MSVCVHALVKESGVPIFSKKTGSRESIEYTSIASLQGINLFCQERGSVLNSTKTANDDLVVWKHFDSITLIGIVSNCLNDELDSFLSIIYEAMILTVGKKRLDKIVNVEQLKRELKPCYQIIDFLMECIVTKISAKPTFDLELIESMACSQALQLHSCLEIYTKKIEGRWSTLVIHGRIAATSKDWVTLHPREARLLQILSVQNGPPLREIYVYLPQTSPYVPFRAITCKLLSDVYVVAICGSTPSLPQIDKTVLQCWESCTQTLKEAKSCYPKNFPFSMEFAPEVLKVLIIDIHTKKCYISRGSDHTTQQRGHINSHRLEILRSFYRKAALELLPEFKTSSSDLIVTETYWILDFYKCYAQRKDSVMCCILFPSSVPKCTMRLITAQTLAQFNIVLEQFNL